MMGCTTPQRRLQVFHDGMRFSLHDAFGLDTPAAAAHMRSKHDTPEELSRSSSVLQVVCDLYDPAQQKVTTFTRTSDASGNLSVQVPGAVNSVPGDFTLKCTTIPRDDDLEVRTEGYAAALQHRLRTHLQDLLHTASLKLGRVANC